MTFLQNFWTIKAALVSKYLYHSHFHHQIHHSFHLLNTCINLVCKVRIAHFSFWSIDHFTYLSYPKSWSIPIGYLISCFDIRIYSYFILYQNTIFSQWSSKLAMMSLRFLYKLSFLLSTFIRFGELFQLYRAFWKSIEIQVALVEMFPSFECILELLWLIFWSIDRLRKLPFLPHYSTEGRGVSRNGDHFFGWWSWWVSLSQLISGIWEEMKCFDSPMVAYVWSIQTI